MAGIYDFIRKRISVGFRSYEVQIKDMDLTAGTPIDYPPSSALDPSVGTNPGEFWVQFLYLIDAKCNQPVPPLDSIIIERDLKPDIEGLPPSLQARGKLDPRMSTSFFQCENPKVGPQHSFTFHSK